MIKRSNSSFIQDENFFAFD